MRVARLLPLLLASSVWAGLPASEARAERLRDIGGQGGPCAIDFEVLRWSPRAGPPAAAIARAFVTHRGRFLMFLGYDDEGMWTAEGYAHDGCEDCDTLDLVHTGATGKRTSFVVVDIDLQRPPSNGKPPVDLEAAIKARLFRLAKTSWPAHRLGQGYVLTTPKHDATGRMDHYTGWLADVSRKGRFHLRYGPLAVRHMCWCDSTWRAYHLG